MIVRDVKMDGVSMGRSIGLPLRIRVGMNVPRKFQAGNEPMQEIWERRGRENEKQLQKVREAYQAYQRTLESQSQGLSEVSEEQDEIN